MLPAIVIKNKTTSNDKALSLDLFQVDLFNNF